jgi:NAD-dependent SIR2 family protein deacetylase
MPDTQIAVFLGAGASCAEGAPDQGGLFKAYFDYARTLPDKYGYQISITGELATFFDTFFKIDVYHDDLSTAQFPTFEEALGILELAIAREESFRLYDNTSLFEQGSKIRSARGALILLIALILDHTLENSKGLHNELVEKLVDEEIVRNFAFISFNYDILIDNALVAQHNLIALDYCLEFTNFTQEQDWHRPNPDRGVRLLKLHGSLNWLYCPTCRTVTLTPKEKGICRLVFDPQRCACSCGTMTVPIIIPPSYFKVLSNLYLQEVWNAAEKVLAESEIWAICGYSFPDADMHVKYLLKRIQVNSSKLRKVIVLNSHPRKDRHDADNERSRLRRFFGPRFDIDYTNNSFEDFVSDPLGLLLKS